MRLNCDLGESFGHWTKGQDEKIMPLIDLANVACGFHAADPLTMQKTVQLACKHNISIGAHPSYHDLLGFGRRSIKYSPQELTAILHYQIGALQAICVSENCTVDYVKPHGAFYNDMMSDLLVFRTVCQALAALNSTQLNSTQSNNTQSNKTYLDKNLPLIVQAVPDPKPFKLIADEYQIELWFEAFADRAYQDNGALVPRDKDNAVIVDVKQVVSRCQTLIAEQKLLSVNGMPLALEVDTLCVHGDNPAAIDLVKQLRGLLDGES
ncbi:MAG: 5-oxoprolinase subunit PxpA [Alteromonadaceae bacterium]|nr:5-oxoprolinase subunit PxpA [Alteromonadaceae bacterium]